MSITEHKKSKRPSFQFYPADYRANVKLRRCSWAARGVWWEIVCLLHDSEEYGILRWTLAEIALAVGCSIDLVQELAKKGVLKGSDDEKDKVSFSESFSQKNATSITVNLIDEQQAPLWYSSRMVRDEYLREKRASHGSKSQNNPNVPRKKGVDQESMDIDKDTFSPPPSSSSSSSINKERESNAHEENSEKLSSGKLCIKFRELGMELVNPNHPLLLELIKNGISESQLIFGISEAVSKQKPFAYGLKIAEDVFKNPQKFQSSSNSKIIRLNEGKTSNRKATKYEQQQEWLAGAFSGLNELREQGKGFEEFESGETFDAEFSVG